MVALNVALSFGVIKPDDGCFYNTLYVIVSSIS